MKKIFTVLVFIILVFQAQAQYKPVLFGLRAGGNIGWIKPDIDEYSSEGVRPGFSWGFMGEFYLMENYALLTGFNMNFIGGKLQYPSQMEIIEGEDTTIVAGDLHRQYSLKYIEIPLCLKMKAAISDKIALFGKIGLGTSFCLGAKASDNFIYAGGEISTDKTNIDDEIALMKESLIVGGGVELKIKGSTALIFELTYDNAFNNILTGSNATLPTGTEPKAVHNFVELSAGIVF
jgi:hypothetical protein